jgi:cytochrome b561
MFRTPTYTRTAIALHWLMAALIVAGFALGLSMVELPFSPQKLAWYSYHKWIGVTVFALAAARLLWRLAHPPPPLPAGLPAWQAHTAGAVHLLLYLLFFATPLAGWLFSSAAGVPTVPFGIEALRLPDLVGRDRALATILKFVHMACAYTLAGLAALHVAAAVAHQALDDHGILGRMLRSSRAS